MQPLPTIKCFMPFAHPQVTFNNTAPRTRNILTKRSTHQVGWPGV